MMRVPLSLLGVLVLVGGCDQRDPGNLADRDNTAINRRDADGTTATPFDQSNERSDIALVADLRAAILDIEDISIAGRNIKIITNAGRAVLRGPVASESERAAIVKVARGIAGPSNITDLLEVSSH